MNVSPQDSLGLNILNIVENILYLVQRSNLHHSFLLGESSDEDLVLEDGLGLPLQVGGDLNIVSGSVDYRGDEYLCGCEYLEAGEEVELHHSAVGVVGEREGDPGSGLGVGPGEYPGEKVRLGENIMINYLTASVLTLPWLSQRTPPEAESQYDQL